LNKEIDVVKTLQAEKVSLSSLLEAEKTKCFDIAKEKDDLSKQNAKLEVQLNDLRRLASSAEDEKKKAEGQEKLYDAKVSELAELRWAHDNLTSEHEAYCDEIERHVSLLCKKFHDLLVDYGLRPAPYYIKEMFIGQIFDWLSSGVSSLASVGRSFGELGAVVASRSLSHTVYSLFKSFGDGQPSLTKIDLCQLRDVNFSWPTEASVEKIPVLLKTSLRILCRLSSRSLALG
jgi:hypothetical protein